MTTNPPDDAAIAAARLLGADRPWRRATDNDLYVEGEYRLRMAHEYLAEGLVNPALREFHLAALVGIQEEIRRRVSNHAMRHHRGTGMTADDIERIRDRAPCQEVAEYLGVAMKPKGPRRWEGHCPFHEDRTPSLSVWESHFVCFGCDAKGDVFALVMLALDARKVNVAGLVTGGSGGEATFRDAVRVLADWAGLPDPTVPPRERSTRGVTF